MKTMAEITAATGVLGLLAGAITEVVFNRYGGWGGLLRAALAGMLVAVLVQFGLHDSPLTPFQQAALIGLSATVADPILSGIFLLAVLFKNNPIEFIADVWSSIRGGKKEGPK